MGDRDINNFIPGWAVVEVMGRQRYAGFLRPADITGMAMVWLDVPPGEDEDEPIPLLFGPSAIYCITPCTEERAREVAHPFVSDEPF